VIAREIEALHTNRRTLRDVGAAIRTAFLAGRLPAPMRTAILDAYRDLSTSAHVNGDVAPPLPVAVRSSATAEDLPTASFAGQQETFLNVTGIDDVLHRIREVFASLYNDRAISYRVHKGFAHGDVALSAGVQRMVRSDLGSAGVMFTIDTESGFEDVVFITSSYGLGEPVVQGAVNPALVGFEADPHGVCRCRRHGLLRPPGAHRRHPARAAQPLFVERQRRGGAGALRADHRGPLRLRDGHRMGPRRT
jgi:pyruvate,water dikinase